MFNCLFNLFNQHCAWKNIWKFNWYGFAYCEEGTYLFISLLSLYCLFLSNYIYSSIFSTAPCTQIWPSRQINYIILGMLDSKTVATFYRLLFHNKMWYCDQTCSRFIFRDEENKSEAFVVTDNLFILPVNNFFKFFFGDIKSWSSNRYQLWVKTLSCNTEIRN